VLTNGALVAGTGALMSGEPPVRVLYHCRSWPIAVSAICSSNWHWNTSATTGAGGISTTRTSTVVLSLSQPSTVCVTYHVRLAATTVDGVGAPGSSTLFSSYHCMFCP